MSNVICRFDRVFCLLSVVSGLCTSIQSESMVLETAENVNNGNPSPLEALLAGAEGFPPMLDIPPDADDETMVELAIALSLQQDQQGRYSLIQHHRESQSLEYSYFTFTYCAT